MKTQESKIAIIVAMSENRVIGRDNQLPWHLPDELKRFRRITTGHTIIMGRRTFESFGRPLPQRRNVVITRQRDYCAEGVETAHSLDDALRLARHDDEVFICGGADIYRQSLVRADRLYLTIVHTRLEGDATFPHIDLSAWDCLETEQHPADDRHPFAFTCFVYLRRPIAPAPTLAAPDGD